MSNPAAVDGAGARSRMLGNSDLRRHNLSAVLRMVVTSGRCTRAALARGTGLTKTAVGGLVADLLESGVLAEEGALAQGVGRPSTPLRLAYEGFAGVVIEISSSDVETTVCDLTGRVLERDSDAIQNTDGAAVLELVVRRARDGVAAAGRRGHRLVGVVLAVHGVVGPHNARVHFMPRLGWVDMDLVGHVQRGLADETVRVLLEHDANLAATAEYHQHRANGTVNLVSISSDLGIGAGIILNGQVYQGSHGYAAEFGHTLVDAGGPECNCGRRGCWSALVGLRQVLRDALPDVAAGLERIPNYGRAALNALLAAAHGGDSGTLGALDRAGTWLGRGAANIANALDPDIIVVGGYLATVQQWVMPAASAAFAERSLVTPEPASILVVSDLGEARVLLGGVRSLLDRLVNDPVGTALART